MFLKILQNSQKKHLHWSLFIIKLQGSGPIKKRFQHRCFPVDFAKFLEHIVYRTPPSGCTWMQCHWGFYPEPNQIRISRGQLLLTTTFKAFEFTWRLFNTQRKKIIFVCRKMCFIKYLHLALF